MTIEDVNKLKIGDFIHYYTFECLFKTKKYKILVVNKIFKKHIRCKVLNSKETVTIGKIKCIKICRMSIIGGADVIKYMLNRYKYYTDGTNFVELWKDDFPELFII